MVYKNKYADICPACGESVKARAKANHIAEECEALEYLRGGGSR